MDKSKRLEPIVGLAKNSERDAARALGQALAQLDQEMAQLQQLTDYKKDYERRLGESASHGMSAQAVNEYREFIAKLAQAIEQQQEAVGRARAELEDKKRFWFARRGRSRALDAVLERYLKDEQKALDRKEQRDHDDRSNTPRQQ